MLLLRTLLYFNSSRIRIFLTRYSVQEFLPHFSLHRIVPRPLTGAVSLARTEIACVPTNRGPGRQTEAAACRGPNSRPGARGTQRLRVFWVPRLLPPPPTPLGSSRRQKVAPASLPGASSPAPTPRQPRPLGPSPGRRPPASGRRSRTSTRRGPRVLRAHRSPRGGKRRRFRLTSAGLGARAGGDGARGAGGHSVTFGVRPALP